MLAGKPPEKATPELSLSGVPDGVSLREVTQLDGA